MPRLPNDDDIDERYVEVATGASSSSKRKKQQQQVVDAKVEISVSISKHLHKLVIGAKGATVQRLRDEFQCDIDIPPQKDPSSDIFIFGRDSMARKAKVAMLELVHQATTVQGHSSSSKDSGGERTIVSGPLFSALHGQESVVLHVDMEKFAHGRVIGPQRIRLDDLKRRVSKTVPGQRTSVLSGVAVVVPDKEDSSCIISVTVPKLHAAAAQQAVEEFISFYELRPFVRSIKLVELTTAATSTPAAASSASVSAVPPAVPAAPALTCGKGIHEGQPAAASVRPASKEAVASSQQHQLATDGKGIPMHTELHPKERKAQQGGTRQMGEAAPQRAPAASSPCVEPAAGAAGKVAAAATAAGPSQQRRPCHRPLTTFVDLAATNGYTHAVQPKRSISDYP